MRGWGQFYSEFPQSGPICDMMRSPMTGEIKQVLCKLWPGGLWTGKYCVRGRQWATPVWVYVLSTWNLSCESSLGSLAHAACFPLHHWVRICSWYKILNLIGLVASWRSLPTLSRKSCQFKHQRSGRGQKKKKARGEIRGRIWRLKGPQTGGRHLRH